MTFYQSISAYYDLIFPVDPQGLSFSGSGLKPGCRILDVACGTGGYSIALAERGHRVTGIDLDRAMIEAARLKVPDSSAAPDFRVMDMLSMRGQLDPGFERIFCIGNSLVHLQSDDRIGQLLEDCHALLDAGGTLILQIINYDRILAEGLTGLPTLRDEAACLEFVRRYELDPARGVVIFRTELRLGGEGERRVIRNEIPLRILEAGKLRELVRAADFAAVELFGGFDRRPFGLSSLPLVLRAQRG